MTNIVSIVLDLEVDDEGLYICAAQNQFGTAEASAYLTITGIGMNSEYFPFNILGLVNSL